MRNEKFQEFIIQLLRKSGLRKKYIDRLCGKEENMILFEQAFTHSSINEKDNYEFFEIIGDVTCNKIIVWYLKERFPELQNAEGVKVIARLRINLVSRKSFSMIAKKIGFDEFIRCDKEIMEQKEKSILEDVFESFFGVTEYLLDQEIYSGSGYGICYRIMKNILDTITISLRYEDLYDPITRLKETFDYYRSPGRSCPLIWGNMLFENQKLEKGGYRLFLCQQDKSNGKKDILYSIECYQLDEGKQQICQQFLDILEEKQYKRPIPLYYHNLNKKNETKQE